MIFVWGGGYFVCFLCLHIKQFNFYFYEHDIGSAVKYPFKVDVRIFTTKKALSR